MNITNEYEVIFEAFTERHFIRSFTKKYKGAWDTTLVFLATEFKFIDALFLKSTAEYITNKDADIVICKTEFKIAGTQESRHGSGNRCIVAIHKDQKVVKVLLVYSKVDVKGSKETSWWQSVIKDNYQDYFDCF